MNNHSVGPWSMHQLTNGQFHIIGTFGDSVAVTIYPFGGTEMARHNARLIAAAPQLLKAMVAMAVDFMSDEERIELANSMIKLATEEREAA